MRDFLTRPPTGRYFSPALPADCFAVDFPGRTISPGEGLLIRKPRLGSGQGCPLLRASKEHFLNVRVLRARRAPGRSLPFLLRPRVARAQKIIRLHPLLSASYLLHYFIFKGSLVDPRLRALNEHIPIVRVPPAGGRLGCPISFPSSPTPQNNARRLSSRRRLDPNRSIRSAHGSHVPASSAP